MHNQQENGFFSMEITDEFVEELDDKTFQDLFLILRENFNNEYQ